MECQSTSVAAHEVYFKANHMSSASQIPSKVRVQPVDSKEDVRDAIARTGQRLSAVELTHTRLKDSWRTRFYNSLERNPVSRFLKDRAKSLTQWYGNKPQREVGYA
jgi:hypothetical protein